MKYRNWDQLMGEWVLKIDRVIINVVSDFRTCLTWNTVTQVNNGNINSLTKYYNIYLAVTKQKTRVRVRQRIMAGEA